MTEIRLHYFSLYIEQNNFEAAFAVIKEAVSLNPDYPNVTKLPVPFMRNKQDFDSAVELCEMINSNRIYPWFEVLKDISIKDGSKHISPDYFMMH